MEKEELKNIRNSRGLSQTAFAEKLGVNIRTIQNWEGGQNNIPKSKELLIRCVFAKSELILDEKKIEILLEKNGISFTPQEIAIFIVENEVEMKKNKTFRLFIERNV